MIENLAKFATVYAYCSRALYIMHSMCNGNKLLFEWTATLSTTTTTTMKRCTAQCTQRYETDCIQNEIEIELMARTRNDEDGWKQCGCQFCVLSIKQITKGLCCCCLLFFFYSMHFPLKNTVLSLVHHLCLTCLAPWHCRSYIICYSQWGKHNIRANTMHIEHE